MWLEVNWGKARTREAAPAAEDSLESPRVWEKHTLCLLRKRPLHRANHLHLCVFPTALKTPIMQQVITVCLKAYILRIQIHLYKAL